MKRILSAFLLSACLTLQAMAGAGPATPIVRGLLQGDLNGGTTNSITNLVRIGDPVGPAATFTNNALTLFDQGGQQVLFTGGVFRGETGHAYDFGSPGVPWASGYFQSLFLSGTNITNFFGGGTAAVPVANSVFVSKLGSDSTGTRGRLDLPFLTLTAAKTAAQSGDTIIVSPGLYANQVDLAKNGVNWLFQGPGCILSNFALNATGNTNAFWSDGATATNFSVLGFPTLIYDTGTNVFNLDTNLDVPAGIGATNALYAISVTNANTTARFDLDSVTLHSFQSAQSPVALNVQNCSNVTFNVRLVKQRDPGGVFTYTSTIIGPVTFTAAATALLWGLGDVYFNFGTIDYFSQYGIWGIEPAGRNTNNLWWNGDEMRTKIYIDCHSQTYRTWGHIGWLNCSNSVAGSSASYFGGFHYLSAQKISDSVVGCMDITSGATVWLDAQKMASPQGWISVTAVASNRVFAIVHEFEDLGGINGGIDIRGGTNFIKGQYMRVLAGVGINFLPSVACKTTIEGMTIDTSPGTGTNRWPVLLAGSGGLSIQNCNLIANAGSLSIMAATAQNIGILGTVMANTNKHVNVTLQPLGTFIVDANLQ